MSSATGIEYIKGTAYCFIDSVILNRKLNKRYKISSVIFSEVRFHYQDPLFHIDSRPKSNFSCFFVNLSKPIRSYWNVGYLKIHKDARERHRKCSDHYSSYFKKNFQCFSKISENLLRSTSESNEVSLCLQKRQQLFQNWIY